MHWCTLKNNLLDSDSNMYLTVDSLDRYKQHNDWFK